MSDVAYKSSEILKALEAKTNQIDSFGQDYIVSGRTIKRMHFLLREDGKDVSRLRSDWMKGGKRFVHFLNIDGKYDYEYYPDERIAYRSPTTARLPEQDYLKARQTHFDYSGSEIIGETIVSGMDCYVMRKDEYTITVWKEKGITTSLTSTRDGGKVYLEYGNFQFNRDAGLFRLPDGIRVVDSPSITGQKSPHRQ